MSTRTTGTYQPVLNGFLGGFASQVFYGLAEVLGCNVQLPGVLAHLVPAVVLLINELFEIAQNTNAPAFLIQLGSIQLGGIVTDIVTIGGTHTFNKHNRLNFAFGYIPQKNFAGPNAISVNETQRINLRATGAMFAVGWSYLFK